MNRQWRSGVNPSVAEFTTRLRVGDWLFIGQERFNLGGSPRLGVAFTVRRSPRRRGDTGLQTTLILPLLGALRRVFKKMVNCDVVVGRPIVLRAWREEPGTVVAVITAEGLHSGALALCFANATADALAREISDEPTTDLPEDARAAAVGDAARMVINLVRRDKRMSGVTLASPVVRTTGPIGEMPQKLRPWVTIPIETNLGLVTVGLSLTVKAMSRDGCPSNLPVEEAV